MFEIRFLGTSASMPTAQRSLSSALVMFGSERFLIDCGEGTQRQILRSGLGFRKLSRVLLTHRHLDHILGLAGLASSLGRWGDMEPMEIWGSPDTLERVRSLMKVVFNPRWESNAQIRLKPIEAGVVFETDRVQVEAFNVIHRNAPCFGFLFREKERRRFLQAEANALGVPFGPERRRLVEGESITLASGRTVHPDEVLGEPIAGARLCFVSDVARTGPLHAVARDADLLVIEGTYLKRDRGLARENGHITVDAAARLARQAHVGHLVIHHVGRRYAIREVLREARDQFSDAIVVDDLDHVKIKKGARLVWERWRQRSPDRSERLNPPQKEGASDAAGMAPDSIEAEKTATSTGRGTGPSPLPTS